MKKERVGDWRKSVAGKCRSILGCAGTDGSKLAANRNRSHVMRGLPRLPLYARVLIGVALRKPERIVRVLMSFFPLRQSLYVTHV